MFSDPSVQIGSYYGSVLQTVDVDGDSHTDLLLVGAPMYMGSERDEQGQVYVYKLDQVQKIKNKAVCVFRWKYLCQIFAEIHTEKIAMMHPLIVSHSVHDLFSFLPHQDGQFQHEFTLKPVNQSCCTAHSESCTNRNEPCGARFGTAIAAVSDLNLDGFNDVAIGAPFENDHRGAVYIYHGDKTSLKEKYVQVRAD